MERLTWPQPPVVTVGRVIDMLTCEPCLVPGRRGPRLVSCPIAESRGAARRLLKQSAVRVNGQVVRDERLVPEPDHAYAPKRKWLACDPAPPLDHPQHVGWLQVGKMRIARIISCAPQDFEGIHLA